jgi:DNA transformation protein
VTSEDIQELFSAFGVVAVRRMFGGAGVYADGTMFALVADGVIYLKADELSTPAFERENLPPFTYATKDGTRGVMSYRRMPERLYDDPDELATWAHAALKAAQRTGVRAVRKRARKAAGKTAANEKRVVKNRAAKASAATKSIVKGRTSNRHPNKK